MDKSNPEIGEVLSLICVGKIPRDETNMRFAEMITNALNLRPTLFHVAPQDAPSEERENLMEAARAMLTSEDVDVRFAVGSVEAEIQREITQGPYQLLILETSMSDPDQPVSPLSQRLANRADVSVLIIRNPPDKIEELLICTGGHPGSAHAISWGIQLAQTTQASATILHVASSTPSMYTGLPALEEGLQQVLTRNSSLSAHLKEAATMAEEAGVDAKLQLRHGVVAEEIVRACEVEPTDLVILGAPKRKALIDRLLLGRIAPQFISSSKCSTLIARGELVPQTN